MPFDSEFDDVYELGIKQACDLAGTYCERVDEQVFHERILDRIYNQIDKADYIIADMTGKNPNVFYEVGYAHALDKPVILLTKTADEIPFDLRHHPHIIYQPGIHFLKQSLSKKLTSFIADKKTDIKSVINPFDIFLYDFKLTEDNKTIISHDSNTNSVFLTIIIINRTSQTINPSHYQIALKSKKKLTLRNDQNIDEIKLPDKEFLYILQDHNTLFPEQPGRSSIVFRTTSDSDYELILFSPAQPKSYPFRIEFK